MSWKNINVELVGVTPLLMNSPKHLLEPQSAVKQKTKNYDHKAEAEKLVYKTDKGVLYVPSTAVKGCMINASSFKKAGKFALKPIVAGGCRIMPEQIELVDVGNKPIKKYDIDLRTVVIQRARVVKARPRLNTWKLRFNIKYNDNLIADAEILKQVLEEGGERVGLLDFRPQNQGDFGCYKVTKFEVGK